MEREDMDLCTEDLLKAKELVEKNIPEDHQRMYKIFSTLGIAMQASGARAFTGESMGLERGMCAAE